jgi:hypothetical protein
MHGPTQGGSYRAAVPQTPKSEIKKNTSFVDTMASEVLRAVPFSLRAIPFSRYQPLKSSDDRYIRIFKNIVVNFKNTQED